MSVGALVVKLGLDAAEFVRGLTKAEQQAKSFSNEVAAGVIKAEIAMKALGEAAAFAIRAFPDLIDKAANFQDLAEKTGASAEGLASFGVAAGTAGTTVDAIAAASVKLTKNLLGVDDESKAAGAAIDALGLNLEDFKKLAPESQMEQISKSLAGFADGAGKTAVATALLGKSGADLLPFLKALEEQGGRQVILTAEQIKQADDFADKQAKARAELQQYVQALATQALPAITGFTTALSDAAKELLGVGNESNRLAANQGVAAFAENAIDKLAFVIDAAQGVKTVFSRLGEFIGASAAAAVAKVQGDTAGLAAIREAYDDSLSTSQFNSVRDRYRKAMSDQKDFKRLAAQENRGFTPGQKTLAFDGGVKAAKGGGSKDDPTKKLLDNQLKEYERAYKKEEDLLQARNKVLDLYYGQNLVSIEDYYASRQANQEEATAKEVALIDQQVAALEKYKSAAKKDTDRAETQGKINALLDKEAELQRKAGETALEQSIKKSEAVRQYKDAIDGVRASLLEMQGDAGAAAAIRVEIQYRDLLTKATAQNDEAAKKLIGTLKQQSVAQAAFNTEANNASQITARLQIEEDRIGISRQLGATGELDSLVRLGESRRAAVVQLRSIVEAQEAIAKASGNPALILNAEQARASLEKLAATADPLADKFNTIFSEGLGNAFGDFLTGAKTAKEAFRDFATSVINQISKIVAQNLASSLFSNLGASTGTNFGSLLSGLFGGGKAIGGGVKANTMYEVAENRPEVLDVNGRKFLLMGNQRGNIDPNPETQSGGGGGYTQNIQYVVQGRIDYDTQNQIAAKVRRQTNTAAARFA